MAKKVDKRKYTIPSLRLRSKTKPDEKCKNCIYFSNKEMITEKIKHGRCKRFDVRVKRDELCDSFSSFYLAKDLGVGKKENISDLKNYQSLSRRGDVHIEETKGIFEEKQYTPLITSADYEKGFIERYFVQRKSHKNNPVLEVQNFEPFNGKYYHQVSLDWKITGPRRQNTYTPDGLLIEKSIFEYNRDSVKFATQKMPQLKFKVSNFTFLAYKLTDTGQVDMEDIETTVQNVYNVRKQKGKKSY